MHAYRCWMEGQTRQERRALLPPLVVERLFVACRIPTAEPYQPTGFVLIRNEGNALLVLNIQSRKKSHRP